MTRLLLLMLLLGPAAVGEAQDAPVSASAEALPELPGELLVFDLRRLELHRCEPDGTRLGFQQLLVEGDDATLQVFTMSPDGGAATQLTHDELGAVTPSWSADGASVLYGSLSDGKIHRVLADGTGDVALTEGGMIKLHPQESPDGAHVMWLESSEEATGLEPEPSTAGGRAPKPLVGKDFKLRVMRLVDGATWPVPLRRGDRLSTPVANTNLLWFQWRWPPVTS